METTQAVEATAPAGIKEPGETNPETQKKIEVIEEYKRILLC